jgi:zinc protease
MRTNWWGILLGCCLSIGQAVAGPVIQHWQSASGAQVYFVENHDLPMLDVAVNFAAGSAYDTAAQSGLAGLTHHMLNLGAGGLSEDEIARKLADVGAQLGGQFEPDRAVVALRTLSNRAEREQALDLLAKAVQQPAFAEAALNREKARVTALLKEADTKPETLAERALARAVYGDHPYALRASGEVATVEKLTKADLEMFYREHYGADKAVVALMGDVSRAEAERIAEQLTAQLPRTTGAAPIPAVQTSIRASEQRIAHPATQSHILIGAPGMARNDPDYFVLYVGNYILGGGGFVSRLMEEVREKRGMAYSVYSYFMPMKQPGMFQIGLQTKKEQADEALQQVRKTLRGFVADGPTAKELKAAQQNIVNGFPLRIDSNKKILDYLGVIGFYGLPLTYLDDFPSKVRSVTVGQVREVFRRRVNPDAMATVVVGAPEAMGAAK